MVCIYQRLHTQKHIITEAIIQKDERALRLVKDEAVRCRRWKKKMHFIEKDGWVSLL